MDPQLGPFPTFLVIGAQGAATKWLVRSLAKHSEVFAVEHEVMFFNRYYQHGPDWYRAAFFAHRGEPVVGEATPGYMMLGEDPARCAARIDGLLPGVRLIAVLMDPVERLLAAVRHHQQRGRLSPDQGVAEVIAGPDLERDKLGLISGGLYGASLKPYVERFGERLLLLPHDDVFADPGSLLVRTLEHIGASDSALPSPQREGAPQPDLPRDEAALTAEDRVSLYGLYEADLALLHQLSGFDVSRWRPDVASG